MPISNYLESIKSRSYFEEDTDGEEFYEVRGYIDEFVFRNPIECAPRFFPQTQVIVGEAMVKADDSKESKVTYSISNKSVPSELEHIRDAIEDASYIKNLKSNWDSEGAIKVPIEIFQRAIAFVMEYSIRAFNYYEIIPVSPEITPLRDGSIDISWNNGNTSLLVNIKNSAKPIAFYYGELYNKEGQIFDVNGQIPTNKIMDTFVSWFVYLSEMEKK